jgi:hypothetical protein
MDFEQAKDFGFAVEQLQRTRSIDDSASPPNPAPVLQASHFSRGKGCAELKLYRPDGKVWECVRANDHKFWRLESALWAEAGVPRSPLKESPQKPA